MGDPRRVLAVSVTIAVIGGAASWYLLATAPSNDSWQNGVSVFMICFAGYAVIAIPFNIRSVRKWRRTHRGTDPGSRWTISKAEWMRFVANDRIGIDNKTLLPNLVNLNMRVPDGGIEIAVSRDAVVVGRELHRLKAFSIQACAGPDYLESDPPAMQFRVTLIAADDSYYDSAIRFPRRG